MCRLDDRLDAAPNLGRTRISGTNTNDDFKKSVISNIYPFAEKNKYVFISNNNNTTIQYNIILQ